MKTKSFRKVDATVAQTESRQILGEKSPACHPARLFFRSHTIP